MSCEVVKRDLHSSAGGEVGPPVYHLMNEDPGAQRGDVTRPKSHRHSAAEPTLCCWDSMCPAGRGHNRITDLEGVLHHVHRGTG